MIDVLLIWVKFLLCRLSDKSLCRKMREADGRQRTEVEGVGISGNTVFYLGIS